VRHLLGISAYYHDSAAALLSDGRIVAAAQEERFSRRKNDERFPKLAAAFCLKQAGLNVAQLDAVVFYDKPITKFGRMLESYLAVAPGGWSTFPRVLPAWLGEKLNLRGTIRYELPGLREDCPILFTEHHQSHAASAFFPSPFDEAAILTVDGVGEWATEQVSAGSAWGFHGLADPGHTSEPGLDAGLYCGRDGAGRGAAAADDPGRIHAGRSCAAGGASVEISRGAGVVAKGDWPTRCAGASAK